MILVSKFMVHRALFDKTYLLLGLLSPLILVLKIIRDRDCFILFAKLFQSRIVFEKKKILKPIPYELVVR